MKRLKRHAVDVGETVTLDQLNFDDKELGVIDIDNRDQAFVYYNGESFSGYTHPEIILEEIFADQELDKADEKQLWYDTYERELDNSLPQDAVAMGHLITLLDGRQAAVIEEGTLQHTTVNEVAQALQREFGNIMVFVTPINPHEFDEDDYRADQYQLTRVARLRRRRHAFETNTLQLTDRLIRLEELDEADVQMDRCPNCTHYPLINIQGFKKCPICNSVYKLFDGNAYIVASRRR